MCCVLQGGAIRATSGYHLFSNVSVTNGRALNAGAGLWLEAADETDVHIQSCTFEGNSVLSKGGALRAGRNEEEGASFKLSIHDCNITGNTVR
jgi:predicted outer membrane repeat protein